MQFTVKRCALVLAPVVVALISSCATLIPKAPITDLAQVEEGEVLAVTTMELEPYFREGDGYGDWVEFAPSAEQMTFDRFIESFSNPGRTRGTWNEPFYFSLPRVSPAYLSLPSAGPPRVQRTGLGANDVYATELVFPSVRVSFPTDAQAVYVGTIRYIRNDFYEIVDVQVIDNYEQAVEDLTAQFGPGIELVRADVSFVSNEE